VWASYDLARTTSIGQRCFLARSSESSDRCATENSSAFRGDNSQLTKTGVLTSLRCLFAATPVSERNGDVTTAIASEAEAFAAPKVIWTVGSYGDTMRVAMMLRVHLLLAVVVLCTSCRHSEPSAPLVVHVLRDPSASFAHKLRQTDLQFALTKPHLISGKAVLVATNEGDSFPKLLRQFTESTPDLLIVDSEADIPGDLTVRGQLGTAELVCGQHPAFIPASVSGELREASQMYLRFLSSHCGEDNQR